MHKTKIETVAKLDNGTAKVYLSNGCAFTIRIDLGQTPEKPFATLDYTHKDRPTMPTLFASPKTENRFSIPDRQAISKLGFDYLNKYHSITKTLWDCLTTNQQVSLVIRYCMKTSNALPSSFAPYVEFEMLEFVTFYQD